VSGKAEGCCDRLVAIAHCRVASSWSASSLPTTCWSGESTLGADPASGEAGTEVPTVVQALGSVLGGSCWGMCGTASAGSGAASAVVPPQRNRGPLTPRPSDRRQLLQGLEQQCLLPPQPPQKQLEKRNAAEISTQSGQQSGQQRLIMNTGSMNRRPRW